MPKHSGILRKMHVQLAQPIDYSLSFSEEKIPLNTHLGKRIVLTSTGNLYCIQCQRKISKTFQQGYCYPCYQRLLECNLCMIHPERCRIEERPCPENDWAHASCGQPHIIYLSNTSGLKVGITRESQVPTRWIDQGAVQAIALFRVTNRYRAGIIEVAFKDFVFDKTNWRAMLKGDVARLDMQQEKRDLVAKTQMKLAPVIQPFVADVETLTENPLDLNYPVLEFPQKITSLAFEKTPTIAGTLLGIKGQYLLLDTGVINLRKYGGYELNVQLA